MVGSSIHITSACTREFLQMLITGPGLMLLPPTSPSYSRKPNTKQSWPQLKALNLRCLIDRTWNSAIPFLLCSSIIISDVMKGLNRLSHCIQPPWQGLCQGFDPFHCTVSTISGLKQVDLHLAEAKSAFPGFHDPYADKKVCFHFLACIEQCSPVCFHIYKVLKSSWFLSQ